MIRSLRVLSSLVVYFRLSCVVLVKDVECYNKKIYKERQSCYVPSKPSSASLQVNNPLEFNDRTNILRFVSESSTTKMVGFQDGTALVVTVGRLFLLMVFKLFSNTVVWVCLSDNEACKLSSKLPALLILVLFGQKE